MLVSVLTLFPEVILPFLEHSIIKRAKEKKAVRFNIVNWRQFTSDKHHTVDDHPYGGGAGMLLMVEPIVKAIEQIEVQYGPAYKILLSPKGRIWDQALAQKMSRSHKHILLLCGHYEGFDERILDYIDEEVSLGNFILSGGESAALVIIDSLVRLLPKVLKKSEALSEETFMSVDKKKLFKLTGEQAVLKEPGAKIRLLEYPQYTKPENFQGKCVPKVLLSGNHAEIKKWRLLQAWRKTKKAGK
jgi:tRNA (guanine37-N1)-methyltransferase